MLPLCDVVPTRRPWWVSAALAAAVTGWAVVVGATAILLVWTGVNAWIWLLLAPSVEDRVGHARLGFLVATPIAVLSASGAAGMPSPPGASTALVAAIAAAHLTLFPRSQLLAIVPMVPLRVVEVPVVVAVATWSLVLALGELVAQGATATTAADGQWRLLSWALCGVWGALGANLLQRRERMSPDWWER